jgi:outer membrane lipoprotein
MKIRLVKQVLLGLALVALSGCVTYPIAKDLQKQAQPLTLSQVSANPGVYQGTVVVWGGKIIKTANDVSNSAIYVLKLPLSHSGEPMVYANSSGRFIASSKGFLDPEVYKSGRLVTVAGTIAGLESEPVQSTKYAYPVLDIKQIHLWPEGRRYYYYPAGGYYYPYYYYPGWGWGWWSPGWSWGWYHGGDWDWDGGYHFHDGGHWGGGYHHDGGGQGHYGGHGGGAYHAPGGSGGGGQWQGHH